jgi:hypothetical protein
MASRKDCIGDLVKKTGRSRANVEDLLNDIFERAQDFEHDGLSPDESYAKARDEKLKEIYETAALERRGAILDGRKDIARQRYYAATAKAIALLPVSDRLKAKLTTQSARLALEAKLVGVNLPFFKGRNSVDAQYVALRRQWVGGFSRDLEKAGLLKIFASRAIEDKWTEELFELNKSGGNVGVTKDAHALAIAKTIQKWQRASMDALNGEGAWVRSYSGYITRSSHDADMIKHVGPEKWVADTLPHLDLRRTFGTDDRQHALDALREMWTPMMQGDHFDYGRPIDEPLYPNLASSSSATRELHFKSGKDWRAYNEQYGVNNATHTVVQALSVGARRTALMKEFGTRPAEAFDKDVALIKASLQQESKALTSRLSALEVLAAKPDLQAGPAAKLEADMAALRTQIQGSSGKFEDFRSWEQPLRNRFAQIDGSSQRPVNRNLANLASNWMAVQRMSKLGRVALTHFASLPSKALEANYWGIKFSERYASLARGLTQGAEGSAKREALDATLVAFENRLGHMMSTYDVADAPAGLLAKWETTFFKLTGVSSVIDNQRGDAEAMFAAHIGGKRGQDWANIGPKEQRVLQGFGLGAPEWKALHGVEWSKFGDRTYLTPSDALKLSDDQVRDYLKESQAGELGRQTPNADDIAKARADLASTLATAYSDRAGFAIPMPSARIRAMMFGKNFEPGTVINTALRLVYQFKLWPADMVVRAWGRELYGRIGDGRYDRVAGLVEAAVGAIVFGVASESVREAIQGKNPIAEMKQSPIGAILKGGQRSGFGSLIGDFLLGEFDRHGFSAVGSLAGPTFSQIDVLMDLLHAGGRTKDGMFSKTAMRERASDLLRLVRDNTPFMNLWATSLAMNTLVWHRLQEWINPGYLARAERRARDQQGVNYIVSPAKTDQWITGKRASPF